MFSFQPTAGRVLKNIFFKFKPHAFMSSESLCRLQTLNESLFSAAVSSTAL